MTERTVGQLVADATEHVRELVRHEIALAKAEMADDAKKAGTGAGLLVVAGVLGLLGLVMGLHAAAWGLEAAGLPTWAGYLIVFGVLVLLAGILALAGRSQFRKLHPPERTIATSKDSVAALKGDRSVAASPGGAGAGRG